MKTPLAWKNLTHNRVRTAIGVAGVGFAVILIFMQMGFKGAIEKTATQIYDALDFDLMLRSPAYLHLTEPRSFPRSRLYQSASMPEVVKARPFYLGIAEWQARVLDPVEYENSSSDEQGRSGQWRSIITMGTDPNDPAFKQDGRNYQKICDAVRVLTDPRFVIVDEMSKAEYGPTNGEKFSTEDDNKETSLGRNTFGENRVRIKGTFKLGTGMASNGACITNPDGFARACYWQPIDQINFGLLKLSPNDPASVKQVQDRLREEFGTPVFADNAGADAGAAALRDTNVEVLTRAEVSRQEEIFWLQEKPIGIIFTLGVWVAMFVGVAIVYQVLSTDIANMMGEYATLKAMGYSNRYLTRVVLLQSVLLAIAGYIPSLIISRLLYWLVADLSGMPMFMTLDIMIYVLFLAIAICVVSGMAALRKLYQADPADLF